MTKTEISTRELLDHVLEVLDVRDASHRERMIDEVEQFIQVKTMLVSLRKLPAEKQKKFSSLPSSEIESLLQQHIGEAEIKTALEKAVDDIVPNYIAELTQTATPEQREKIEKLIEPFRGPRPPR